MRRSACQVAMSGTGEKIMRLRLMGSGLVAAAAVLAVAVPGVAGAGTSVWIVQTAPLISGSSSADLAGISCPALTSCTAVGNSNDPNEYDIAEQWNGSTWTPQDIPDLTGYHPTMDAVSCASATVCTAIGDYSPYNPIDQVPEPVAWQWNGSTWTGETLPFTTADAEILTSVSCLSADNCMAAGYGATGSNQGNNGGLAAHWNGSTWTIKALPAPSGNSDGRMLAISCTSPGNCTAAGEAVASTGDQWATLAEHWDGHTWAIQPTPDPSGSVSASLEGVSCLSPANCMAVGYYANSSLTRLPFAEHWNGSTWTVENVPLPSRFAARGATLTSVSCATAGQCTAVGAIPLSAPRTQYRALAEVSRNGTWKVQLTASPETSRDLTNVSCVKANPGTCTAIGVWNNNYPGPAATLVEHK